MTDLERCSSACTRAGITAILTVAVSFALLESLQKYQEDLWKFEADKKNYEEQVEYLNLRQRLSEKVDFFMIDPCYRIWTHSKHIALELLTLKEVAEKIDCSKVGGVMDQFLEWALESQTKAKSIYSPAFQLPPEHLIESKAISDEITTAIFDVLSAHDRLRHNDFIARHGLAFETFLAMKLRDRHQWVPKKDTPTQYTLHARYGLKRMYLLENELPANLTVQGALELVGYRLPPQPEKPKSLLQSNVVLPQVAIPLNPITGAVLLQFIFLLSSGYFLLFQREAIKVSGTNYPGTATLFSVFQQSFITKGCFSALSLLPILSSLKLTLLIQDTDLKWVMWCLFMVITLIVVRINIIFRSG